MKSTPFNTETDLATTPFSEEHLALASELKRAGLPWKPHVGCFVWDRDALIEASSPFPNRIYFILNLGHFLRHFETSGNIAEKLVWMPTWHQARLLCRYYGIHSQELHSVWLAAGDIEPGQELVNVYRLLLKKLQKS
ncbi:MAG: hypothetical protein JXA73_09795 [Acidobacteria bacterium]|nr:hypothetical protein [Acidobacteriota bacterium]